MRLSNIFSLYPLWGGIVIIFWDANFLQKLPRRISCCRIKGVVWMGIIYLPLVKCYCIVFKHVYILLQYCLSCMTKLFIDMVVVWVLKLVGIGRGNPFIQELFPMHSVPCYSDTRSGCALCVFLCQYNFFGMQK